MRLEEQSQEVNSKQDSSSNFGNHYIVSNSGMCVFVSLVCSKTFVLLNQLRFQYQWSGLSAIDP